ncbi:unnamed protein product [Plasmodium vivax]|uniref:(malaria parasite P. vivax) hypothetical protein n=1 Tax=Plasmodium vivax TaxID=5855 RepID=A0A8S4HKE3_PLAVI|nr:unnamed protein product [Plasmodium vivax]
MRYESVRLFPKFEDVYNVSLPKYQTEYVSQCDDINKDFFDENDDSFKIVCQKIGVFTKYLTENNYLNDKNGACKYLNYVINKGIIEFKNSDYENKEFYDKLINEFYEKIFNLSAFCTESIQYLDKNKFENMGKLYKLYSSFHKYINKDPQIKDYEDGSVDESDFDTDISQNSVFIAFSIILVVSVTLFILYKFTPFGSFTRLKIHQNKKKFEKIQDRIHKIFRIHKHHLEDSNNNRFNMPYHPKQNYQLK